MMISTDTPFDFLMKVVSLFFLPFIFLNGNFSVNKSSSDLEFREFVTKIYAAGQNAYIVDKTNGVEPKECYSVEKEIGLSDPGKYKGYVCLHEESDNNITVYVSLTDGKYSTYTKVGNKTYNYINYTKSGEPASIPDSMYVDYKAYVSFASDSYSNKLEVVTGKPVNDYEI